MITYLKGDLLTSDAVALVNTVNTVGVMGKGIAPQFKKAYPSNYQAYKKACENEEIAIGKCFTFRDQNVHSGYKVIINFPTKKHWRNPSKYEYISEGLIDLEAIVKELDISSIAIPPLGTGNGGLEWGRVKVLIEEHLAGLDVDIRVYEPNARVKEVLKKERVKLTKARALLMYLFYDQVRQGQYPSEFSGEKIAYFLQLFGGEKYFNLSYQKSFYGPYSGKVRYLIHALNGSYIFGYNDMNKKPFEPISVVADGYQDVQAFIDGDVDLRDVASRTMALLEGLYSDYGLELLSSVDFIARQANTFDKSIVINQLAEWSQRKNSLVANSKHLDLIIDRLKSCSPQLQFSY